MSNADFPPLRKIIRRFMGKPPSIPDATVEIPLEELECGHVVAEKQDIYGYTNAERRRCWKCLRAAAAIRRGETA